MNDNVSLVQLLNLAKLTYLVFSCLSNNLLSFFSCPNIYECSNLLCKISVSQIRKIRSIYRLKDKSSIVRVIDSIRTLPFFYQKYDYVANKNQTR